MIRSEPPFVLLIFGVSLLYSIISEPRDGKRIATTHGSCFGSGALGNASALQQGIMFVINMKSLIMMNRAYFDG